MKFTLAAWSLALAVVAGGQLQMTGTVSAVSTTGIVSFAEQRGGGRSQEQVPESIAKLLTTIRDVAKLVAAREAGRSAVFFALPIRNGDIAEAVEAVRKQNLQARAVTALLGVIKETRESSKIEDQTTCANAVRALGELGPDAAAALSILKELNAHPDPMVPNEVGQATSPHI